MNALTRGIVLFFVSLSVFGQAKVPVNVFHGGDDQVGQMFVYEVREAIRGSNGMRLVEKDFKAPHISLAVATLDLDPKRKGDASAVGTTILFDAQDVPLLGLYLSARIQTCGRDVIKICATKLLADVDKTISELRELDSKLWARLYPK